MTKLLITLFLTLTLCNCTKLRKKYPDGQKLAYMNERKFSGQDTKVLAIHTVRTDGVRSRANFSMLARSYQDKSVCCLVYNKNHGIKSSFCKNKIHTTYFKLGEILVYGVTLEKYNVQVSTYDDDYEPNCNLYRP